MNSKYHFFIISFCFLFLSNCASNSNSRQDKVGIKVIGKYKSIAIEKLSTPTEYIFNSTKTIVICTDRSKNVASDPTQVLHFFVYDIEKDSVIYEDSVLGGKINWFSNSIIEIGRTPGIVSGKEGEEKSSNAYYYDIKLQKKVKRPLIQVGKIQLQEKE